MPASSDGDQGLQNQGGNHQNAQPVMHMILLDQTQSQPPQIVPSIPIQEGYANRLGQARFTDAETDGTQSLMYNNLEVIGNQASPSQQPSQQVNEISQPRASDVTSLSSTGNIQSGSGFSDAALLNQPARDHPRPIQSLNTQLEGAAINVDLQCLKRKLKQKLGNKYEKDVANCVRTFNDTTLSEADVSKCSSQLLYYFGGNVVVCMKCRQRGDIGTIFIHEERCIVGICSQGDQDVRQSNLPNSTEGNINVPMESFYRRQEGELQNTATRQPTNGATGEASHAGGPQSEETSFKAAHMPDSFQTCSERGYTTAPAPPPNQTAQNVHLTSGGSTNGFDQNGNHGPCFPPSLPNSTEGHVTVQMKLLALDRRQEGRLQDREPTDGATGGALQVGALLSEKASYKAAILPSGSSNEFDQNRNPGPCLPPSLPNSTEGHVNVQMKLLALDRRQEGGLQDRGPTDGATGGALQAGALLSEETSYKAAILPNEDTRKLLLEMGFKEDKIHRAQQIFKNRKSNMEWTVADFLDILDNEIHQENVMDPSICGVCHERKAAASQFECRHVVCLDCAPKRYADRCKICNRPVVRVVAIDL